MGERGGTVNPVGTRLVPASSLRVAARPASQGELPEEGLEPTRTYAQALLRRPRLPFRHSGAGVPGEYIRVRSLGTY
jgi:hypothetical protein